MSRPKTSNVPVIPPLSGAVFGRDSAPFQSQEWELRTLLESLPQAVMFVGADGKPFLMNEPAIAIMKAPDEVVLRTSVFDMTWNCRNEDGSEIPCGEHPVALALKQGIFIRDKVLVLVDRENGNRRWFELSVIPRFIGDNAVPAEAMIIFREITERKLADAMLRESEDRFRRMVETVSDYLYTVRFENEKPVETVHNAACRMVTGYTQEDFRENPMLWIGMVHPDDRQRVRDLFDPLRKTPYLNPIEHRITRKDGSERWIRNTPTLHFNLDGSIHSLEGVVQDITDRKAAEQRLLEIERRFREMFETSVDGIASIDLENRILDCNPAYAAMLGYASPADLLSRTFRDVTPPSYHDLDERMLREMLEKGACTVYEKEYVRNDGERFPVNIRRWLRRDAKGKPVGQWVIVRDLTEKRRMDTELLRMQHIESLSTLAGGIAHDFNNLLGGIFGYIDIAREFSKSPVKSRAYLEKALGSLERAKDLSQRLLIFSKGGEPNRALSSVARLIRETTAFSLAGCNVRAQFAIAADLASCEIDTALIGRVVSNILLNAVQAMPDGGAIVISAENVEIAPGSTMPLAPGAYVKITIRDNGPGISRDILAKIFDPFFTTKPKGTGLGLPICLSIARKHGGHIAVESELGKGTAAFLYLPSSPLQAVENEDKTKRLSRGHGKILVMDDEEFVLDIAEEMLSNLGYAVTTAQHGEAAIEQYRKAAEEGIPFDAVILDLTVPGGMGGVKTCEALRRIDSGVRVIASSGYSNDPVMASPEKYGFASTLKKPYLAADLSAVLKRLLGKKKPSRRYALRKS